MSSSRTLGIARIVVLVGGTCAEMARYVKALAADVVLWIDVHNELEKVKAAPGVIRLVLAPGQTLATLFDGLPDNEHTSRICEYLKSRPGVDLNIGLAQAAFAGLRAAELLVATPEFRAVLQQLYSQILIMHNGTVEKVELELFSSGCGGTGGPAGGPIVAEIARYYREHHRAVVHARFNRAGSLSFEGLGDAIHLNRAANVFADLTYTLLDTRPLNEVRALNFFELPMVVKDKATRDRYMATMVQALNCSEFREVRDVSTPNEAAHNSLGSIALLDAAWWHPLGAECVRMNVAACFAANIREVLATTPDNKVLDRIEVETMASTPVAEATIPQIIDRVHQSKRSAPAGLLDAVENVTCCVSSITVHAHCRTTGRAAFNDWWRERCKSSCRTMPEFRDRLAFLRGLAKAVESEMTFRSEKIAGLQNQRSQTKSALNHVKDEYYPQTVAGMVANWLFADSRRRDRDRRFGTLATSMRETKLAVDTLEAENNALGACRRDLQGKIAATERRLRSVVRILGSEDSLDRTARKEDLIEVANLDSVLYDLLQIADAPEVHDQLLADTLLGCAKRVTLAGLKSITGAHEPRVDLIAGQLNKRPPTIGPFWGGKRPMTVHSTVFVLPPVASELRARLTAAFAPLVHHSNRFQLVFADTAEAGFNVVRLQVRHPKTYGEIVTPQIADEFDEIAVHPERYFPRDFDVDRIKQFVNGHCHETSVPVAPR